MHLHFIKLLNDYLGPLPWLGMKYSRKGPDLSFVL